MSSLGLFVQSNYNPDAGMFLCCAGVVVIPIALVFFSFVLRTACYIASIQPPTFDMALGVVFVVALAEFVIDTTIAVGVFHFAGERDFLHWFLAPPGTNPLRTLSALIAFVVDTAASGAIIAGMLGVSFRKAAVAYLVSLFVTVGAVLAIAGIAFACLFLSTRL